MRIVDVDDQIAVGLAVRAVSGERDDDGILRRAGASDERDVLQERRARGHVVALAADLAGARGAALIQRAARIARRAELDGTQAGTIDRLEVADLHGLGLVRGDMVGNGTGVRHDDELAGRDLAAGAVGRVVDGVAARAARRLERHAADVAGRILVARRDGAGQGAGGIDRAGRRQREGEGAGRGARGLLDRVGELAAVEHDVRRILLEHQLHILRRGNGDGDVLGAGVFLAVNGGLGGQLGRAAGDSRHLDALAGGIDLDDRGVAGGPADGRVLARDVDIALRQRVILLRGRRSGDHIARLDRAGVVEVDLNKILAADRNTGNVADDVSVIARNDLAVEGIGTRSGDDLGQIQLRNAVGLAAHARVGLDCIGLAVVPDELTESLTAGISTDSQLHRCAIQLVSQAGFRLVLNGDIRNIDRLGCYRPLSIDRIIECFVRGIFSIQFNIELVLCTALHRRNILDRQVHGVVRLDEFDLNVALLQVLDGVDDAADGACNGRSLCVLVADTLPDIKRIGSVLAAVDRGIERDLRARLAHVDGHICAGSRNLAAVAGKGNVVLAGRRDRPLYAARIGCSVGIDRSRQLNAGQHFRRNRNMAAAILRRIHHAEEHVTLAKFTLCRCVCNVDCQAVGFGGYDRDIAGHRKGIRHALDRDFDRRSAGSRLRIERTVAADDQRILIAACINKRLIRNVLAVTLQCRRELRQRRVIDDGHILLRIRQCQVIACLTADRDCKGLCDWVAVGIRDIIIICFLASSPSNSEIRILVSRRVRCLFQQISRDDARAIAASCCNAHRGFTVAAVVYIVAADCRFCAANRCNALILARKANDHVTCSALRAGDRRLERQTRTRLQRCTRAAAITIVIAAAGRRAQRERPVRDRDFPRHECFVITRRVHVACFLIGGNRCAVAIVAAAACYRRDRCRTITTSCNTNSAIIGRTPICSRLSVHIFTL